MLRDIAGAVVRRFTPRLKVGVRTEAERRTVRCGSEYGGWNVAIDEIPGEPVVYSFGIGEDISFDLALMDHRPAATIHAFDPTPRSIEWLGHQALPQAFQAHEFGLAAFDGDVDFFAPRNPTHVSHSILVGATGTGIATKVPVRRLQTIMDELGHARIDVLKMDIEGAEYEVIKDLTTSTIRPPQLFVEFHHRFPGVGVEMTRTALTQLHGLGYRVYWVSATEEEYSLVLSR